MTTGQRKQQAKGYAQCGLFILAMVHLNFWTWETTQWSVRFNQQQGYVTGWEQPSLIPEIE